MVEFQHSYLTQPYIALVDRITHGLAKLARALQNAPASACDAQCKATANLWYLFPDHREQSTPALFTILMLTTLVTPLSPSPKVPIPTQNSMDYNRHTYTTTVPDSVLDPCMYSTPVPVTQPSDPQPSTFPVDILKEAPGPRVYVSTPLTHKPIAHHTPSLQPLANLVTPCNASRRQLPTDLISH